MPFHLHKLPVPINYDIVWHLFQLWRGGPVILLSNKNGLLVWTGLGLIISALARISSHPIQSTPHTTTSQHHRSFRWTNQHAPSNSIEKFIRCLYRDHHLDSTPLCQLTPPTGKGNARTACKLRLPQTSERCFFFGKLENNKIIVPQGRNLSERYQYQHQHQSKRLCM